MGFANGNIKELEILYKRHFNRLMLLASRYSLNKETAEDALHDSFIIIFKKISGFRGAEEQLSAWMNKIVINKSFEISRRRNKIKFLELLDEEPIQCQEVAMNSLNEAQLKKDISIILNARQKTVFDLKEVEGFSHKEISSLLEIKESHSRIILARAKSKLKKHFSSMGA